jgi:hypothetical protein
MNALNRVQLPLYLWSDDKSTKIDGICDRRRHVEDDFWSRWKFTFGEASKLQPYGDWLNIFLVSFASCRFLHNKRHSGLKPIAILRQRYMKAVD